MIKQGNVFPRSQPNCKDGALVGTHWLIASQLRYSRCGSRQHLCDHGLSVRHVWRRGGSMNWREHQKKAHNGLIRRVLPMFAREFLSGEMFLTSKSINKTMGLLVC